MQQLWIPYTNCGKGKKREEKGRETQQEGKGT